MKKLTDDRIDEIWEGLEYKAPVYLARAVESEVLRLNGIGEQAAPQQSDLLRFDDDLRFVQRVLESNAPESDKELATQMVRDIRRSVRPVYAETPVQERAAPPAAPPEFVLVPVEPTEAMLYDGVGAFMTTKPGNAWCPNVWAAMLSAAPKQEQNE